MAKISDYQANVFPHNPVQAPKIVGPEHANLHNCRKGETQNAETECAKQTDKQSQLGNGGSDQESENRSHETQEQHILCAIGRVSDLLANIVFPYNRNGNVTLQSIGNENRKSEQNSRQLGKPGRRKTLYFDSNLLVA